MKKIIPNERTLRNNLSSYLPTKATHFLANVYATVMNKSDFMSIDQSRILNHLIPSKGDRKLIVNADLSSQFHTGRDLFLVDKLDPDMPVSLHLQHCKSNISKLLTFTYNVKLLEYSSQYCFSNNDAEVIIPKLTASDQDSITYDLDLYNHVYIDYFDVNSYENKMDIDCVIGAVIKSFDPSLPIKILIAQGKIIGFEQNSHLINSFHTIVSDSNNLISTSDAITILTSFNFHHIRGSKVSRTFTRVLKTYDNQYWLSTDYDITLKPTQSTLSVNVLEHLEITR